MLSILLFFCLRQKSILIKVLFLFHLIYPTISENSVGHYSTDQKSIDPEPFPPGWIDPFDMLGDQSRHSLPGTDVITYSDVETKKLKERLESCELHWLKLVNTLLKAIEMKDDRSTPNYVRNVKLDYLLFENDYNLMKRFVKNQGTSVRDVSNTLIKIFSQVNLTHDNNKSKFTEIMEWLKKAMINLMTSPEWVVVTSVMLLTALTLWLVFVSHSFRLAIFTTLLTIFFASFGFTWMRMYEEKEAQRFAKLMQDGREAPYHCRGLVLPWYQYLFYREFGADCYEYYKMRDVRTLVKVSPLEVLTETISAAMIHPLKNAGKGYESFITSMTENSPWYIKIIAKPFAMFITTLLIIFGMLLMCNYKLIFGITGLSLLPSGGIKPSLTYPSDRGYVEDICRTDRKSLKRESSDGSTISLHLSQSNNLLRIDIRTDNEAKESAIMESGEENIKSSNNPRKEEHCKPNAIKNKPGVDPVDEENLSIGEDEVMEDITSDKLPKHIKKRSRSAFTISFPNSASRTDLPAVEQQNSSALSNQVKTPDKEKPDDFKTK